MGAKSTALTTAAQVKALKPAVGSYARSIQGSRGLYVKVQASGRKTWFYRCRRADDKSKFEWMRLGEFKTGPGGMSLAEARDEVERQRLIRNEHGSAKKHRDVERAKNLQALQSLQTESKQDAYTVKVMCEEYIEEASRELKSWIEVGRALNKYVTPKIGDQPAHGITCVWRIPKSRGHWEPKKSIAILLPRIIANI